MYFNIPRQQADGALTAFGQQADITVLYRYDLVEQCRTNQLLGQYTLTEAVSLLLANTGLKAEFDRAGHLIIIITRDDNRGGESKMYKKNKLSVGILAALASLFGGGANAQSSSDDANMLLEEVVVTGIRSSLERALDIKQQATGFVDAISAEDIGKLPDQNVAEALQRVPGVAIQRSRGEGDFVSIRGLGSDFVRGTINGRSLINATETVDPIFNGNRVTSTGRAANFDVLPSEVINTLEVVKSTSAKHVEGGIGGSVNLSTARPLTLGNKKAGSVTSTYRDFNEETDPSFSGLFSWADESNRFGVLGAVSYAERSIREDFSRTFGWFPSFGISSQLDTNDDGIGDAGPGAVPFPLSNNAEAYEEDRERLTLTGTLQWAGEDSELVVDLLYSEREVEERHQNLIFLPIIREGDGDLAGRTVNPLEDELLTLGVNFTQAVGDWELTTDVSYSKAEGDNTFDRVRIDGDNGNFAFDSSIGSSGFTINQTNLGGGAATDLGNPANFVISVFDDRFASNEDEELALQFDAVRVINHSVVSSIEIGARIRTREKTIQRAANGNGIGVAGAGVTLADIGAYHSGASNFLDGMWRSNFGYNSLLFPDNPAARANAAIRAYMTANGLSTALSADPFGSFEVEEDTYASYVQLNLDGDIAGVSYIGDFGFRVVLTRQTVNGSDAEFVITDNGGMDTTVFDTLTTGTATAVSFDDSYANVLPSLNLRFELAEAFYLRVAANKSMTRPTFNDLAPAFSINANSSSNLNGDNYAVSLSAGNPALKPYESTNFDLGVEWYFAESSALYAGLFHKEIEEFVAVVTNNNVTELAGNPIRAIGVEMDGSRNPIAIDQVSQPDNQGEAQITGLEIGYQQAFDSGFGYITNITLTENSAEFEATGEDIDFPGVSEVSYNLTAYYESGPLQARLSYSFRSDYLVEASAIGFGGQIFNDDYAQLDGSVSYEVTDNFTVFLNAVNLTDEDQDVFQILPGIGRRYSSTSHVGPRFAFGVRGTF